MCKDSITRPLRRLLPIAVGAALLLYLIVHSGAGTVGDHLKAVGWGLLLILALGGVSHLLRASAWRLTFHSGLNGVSLARTFGLRLIGEAIGTFGLAGQVVGDSMRVSLLGPVIPIADRISSVALDRAASLLTSAVIGVTGILAAVMLLSLRGIWRVYALLFAATVTAGLVLGLVSFSKRLPLLSHIAHGMQQLPWAKEWLKEKVSVIESAEENLLSFRSRAPKSFWAVIALFLFSQLLAISEVYLLLRFMGVEMIFAGAFVIEALTKLINIVGAVNPGNIGTYEGGNLLVARLLGFPSAAGLSLALCRRARIIFWAAIGALYLATWTPGKTAPISRT